MDIALIKKEFLERWRDDPPLATLCLQIIDFMAAQKRGELQMLTFTSFMNATGKQEIDSQLLKAIAVLVNSSHALLVTHAMLVDEEDQEYEIAPEEWADARETGHLIHPLTGMPVEDFESKVFPFFVPSQYFQSALD